MSEYPWIKSYPNGVRWDAEIKPMVVHQLLQRSVERWPDRPALVFMGRTWTYRELDALTSRVARGLQDLGVGPGVHVGLFLPNSPHYIVGFLGIMKSGGTAVNYSPLDASEVLKHKIEDSQTDFVITVDLAALYPQMAAMLGQTRLKKLIVGNIGEMTPAPDAVNGRLGAGKLLADVQWGSDHLKFADLIDNDGACRHHPVDDPADTVAVLQYTGGTTGLPKGAMLTHGNLTAAVQQYMESTHYDPPIVVPGEERMVLVLPPFHIYALTANILFGLAFGAELFQEMRFDAAAVLQCIADNKVTVFMGVPTMYTAMLADPKLGEYDLSSLKLSSSGGASLPTEVLRRFQEITGSPIGEGWGMTETSPSGTFTPIGQGKPGSCGIPLPGIVIKLLSLEDEETYMPIGEKGEICIKGANVMKGYWHNEKATAENLTADGFMRTGDVAYMDEDGYLFIVDRTKDMLLCSGYNVYPRVLEEAVYQHPSVAEVCVIGVPDDYRGQSPKAFVVLKDGAKPFTLDELKEFLKDKLGKHEMIRELELRDELPKTAVGKLSKKMLADEEARKRAEAQAGA